MDNKSAYFCTQMLEFDKAPVKVFDKQRYYVDTYLIDPVVDGGEYSGYVYLAFRGDLPDTLVNYLVRHPAYHLSYCPKDGLSVYAFKHGDYADKVVEPFWRGAYSQIDKEYVEKYFPSNPTAKRYQTRLIIDKAQKYRDYWEDRIGQRLPDDAEVWSIPIKDDETFRPDKVVCYPEA